MKPFPCHSGSLSENINKFVRCRFRSLIHKKTTVALVISPSMMHNGRTSRPSPIAGTRRAPIPRPWLTEHHYMHHVPGSHPLHHDYRYVPPLGAPYTYPIPNGSLDLLQRPDWKVSWSKLSCCFCTRSQKEAGGTKNVQDIHRRRGHNDNVPFPAFPILRRNSSSSLMLNENDIYPVSHMPWKYHLAA